MSTIQEKMEALRLEKDRYSGAGAGTRKFHNAPKNLRNKHPTLPKTTAKTNPYAATNQVSLFNHNNTSSYSPITQPKKPPLVTPPQHLSTPPPYSPIQSQHKSATASPKGSNGDKEITTTTKLIPSLDPLQSCYGSRRESRTSQLIREVTENAEGAPKSILSRPSSPVVTPGKKKKVTFNFEDRPSSSSYAPPSCTPSGIATRGNGSSNGTNAGNGRPMRPSLSEQLSAIADKASDVTADIRAKAGLDNENNHGQKPLLTSPAKNFTVGHLQCRYAAPAEFFLDRLEYKFHHPFENSEIHLTLYYRDMINACLTASPSPGKLIFRVPRHLVHFAADYDPSKHYVVLFLSSSADLAFIRKNIMPKLK